MDFERQDRQHIPLGMDRTGCEPHRGSGLTMLICRGGVTEQQEGVVKEAMGG